MFIWGNHLIALFFGYLLISVVLRGIVPMQKYSEVYGCRHLVSTIFCLTFCMILSSLLMHMLTLPANSHSSWRCCIQTKIPDLSQYIVKYYHPGMFCDVFRAVRNSRRIPRLVVHLPHSYIITDVAVCPAQLPSQCPSGLAADVADRCGNSIFVRFSSRWNSGWRHR